MSVSAVLSADITSGTGNIRSPHEIARAPVNGSGAGGGDDGASAAGGASVDDGNAL
jgi:hypothetical protein